MTLKIMSGIVLPSKTSGYVKIMFDDHSIQHDSDGNVVEKKTPDLRVHFLLSQLTIIFAVMA